MSIRSSPSHPSMRRGGYTTHTTADGEVVRTYLDVGENPPAGVIVTYRLVATPDVPLALVFRDAVGEEVRTVSSRTADPPQAKERRAPTANWEAYNYGVRLLAKLIALSSDVALGHYRPTDVADEVFSELQRRIDQQIAAFERLLADDVPAFNTRLAEAQLAAVLAN